LIYRATLKSAGPTSPQAGCAVDVIVKLPLKLASPLSLRVQSWLGKQENVRAERIQQLILKFLDEGDWLSALRLFRGAFAIFPDERFYQKEEDERFLPRPRTLLTRYEYEPSLLALIPRLTVHADLYLVWVLCDLLADMVRFSRKTLSH
jgi:hypothetical protein